MTVSLHFLEPRNNEKLASGWYLLVNGAWQRCKNKKAALELLATMEEDERKQVEAKKREELGLRPRDDEGKMYTTADFKTWDDVFAAFDLDVIPTLERWRQRGDGAAVYQNVDMGHPLLGHLKAVSYGSPQATLEGSDPPKRLPDMGGSINWRYQLVGTVRGDS